MKKICIDGAQIRNREELFQSLKEQLQEENFLGNNLDALYDVLTQSAQRIEVELQEPGALREALGDYMDRLLKVLWDSCAQYGKEERDDS